MKLVPHLVAKPWGTKQLPTFAGSRDGEAIGELWFESPDGRPLPLLIKYIFTSERLSVQVHPDDGHAQARGHPHGKSECWYIVDAAPGATLALGLARGLSPDELRNAALDGSIETLLDWVPVSAGDFFYVPAGTIHAIGAGITLIEIQQPSDVTYRLFDYGRPRELHLDDAGDVARRDPGAPAPARPSGGSALVEGPYFSVHRVRREECGVGMEQDRLVVPLAGEVRGAGPGDCLFIAAGEPVSCSTEAEMLIAWRVPGA